MRGNDGRRTGGEILIDQLVVHGVRHAFCVPGESYLAVLERVMAANPLEGGWLAGGGLTYADLSLFQVVEGLRYAFPHAMAARESAWPQVIDLRDRVAARPRIAAYLASDRRIAFNQDGIFRSYPELDD